MFRRMLSGLFVAALALAGAGVAPVRADAPGGWVSAEQAAVVQAGRTERLVRASDGRSAPQHPGLALLPATAALERAPHAVSIVPSSGPVRLPASAPSPHGARAPPV